MRVFDDNHIITTSVGLLTASLPFITIGLLNRPIILATALISGGIGIVGIILGLFLKDNTFLSKAKIIKVQDYFFPYVLALSSAILETHGIDASSGYWLALGIAIAVLITSILPHR